MRTGKSISNIGYMSSPAFEARANDLRLSGVIGPCLWIAHKAENHEKKDHLHILLPEGYMAYETIGLDSKFGFEILPDGSKASLTSCWKKTKDINDWILYSVHNIAYLAHKGQFNKTPYDWSGLKCTKGDEALLETFIIEAKDYADNLGDKAYKIIRQAVNANLSWDDILASGWLPMSIVNAAYSVYQAMLRTRKEP